MSIYIWDKEIKDLKIWTTTPSAVYLWDTKVRPSWPDKDYLCFTAEEASSTIKLEKSWTPTEVTLETSTDWRIWSDYTINTVITLANVWDKLYLRNKSETVTEFSTTNAKYYRFITTWKIWVSWDIDFLLCKNSTDTIPNTYCFYHLFYGNSAITSCPKLPATTLKWYCYDSMFVNCTWLLKIPRLDALYLPTRSYYQMFYWCSSIKLSTSQTWDYTQAYRIPTEWTWSVQNSNALSNMFSYTWWTWKSTPTINTTYYTSNTVV